MLRVRLARMKLWLKTCFWVSYALRGSAQLRMSRLYVLLDCLAKT